MASSSGHRHHAHLLTCVSLHPTLQGPPAHEARFGRKTAILVDRAAKWCPELGEVPNGIVRCGLQPEIPRREGPSRLRDIRAKQKPVPEQREEAKVDVPRADPLEMVESVPLVQRKDTAQRRQHYADTPGDVPERVERLSLK